MAEEIIRYEDRDGAQITLTPQDVAAYCAKGSAQLTQRDVVNFMATCKALGANPYLGDVYLVKYGSEDASIMAGKNYYTRVAVSIPSYDGMQAGIICVAHDGSVAYRHGAMAYPGDRCIGGWAEVHDKRWSTPVRSEVAMDEYNTHRSLWKSKPLTMIRKVALVQALRESYPDRFAGTYDASEMGRKGEQEPPAAAPAPAQPVQASVEPTRPSEEDVAWLRENVANLVALGYKESEVKGYLWHQYQDGGREAAQQAVVGLIAGAGGTVEQPQEAEP
jgi:phage recombination protein Bet